MWCIIVIIKERFCYHSVTKKQNYILKHTVSSHVHIHSHISLHQEMLFIVLYNSYGIHPENWKQTVCKVKYKIHIYTLYSFTHKTYIKLTISIQYFLSAILSSRACFKQRSLFCFCFAQKFFLIFTRNCILAGNGREVKENALWIFWYNSTIFNMCITTPESPHLLKKGRASLMSASCPSSSSPASWSRLILCLRTARSR